MTTFNFSFTHPAVAAATGAMTVSVRNANATTQVGTSNTFAVISGNPNIPGAPTSLALISAGNQTLQVGFAPPAGATSSALFFDDFNALDVSWAGGANATASATAGSGSFVLAGHTWTVTAGGVVQQDGVNAGFTANVTAIYNVAGVVWQVNSSVQWYFWDGTQWTAGSAPIPATWMDHFAFGGNEYFLSFVNEQEYMCDVATAGGNVSSTGYQPFSVSNSVLTITAQTTGASGHTNPAGQPWNSGCITSCTEFNGEPTSGLFARQFGYFEMKCKVPSGGPTNGGPGFWPAFVLYPIPLPPNFVGPGEIDIFEILGASTTIVRQSIHNGQGTGHEYDYAPGTDFSQAFHTYGVDWQADFITFYVDRVQTARQATTSDMQQNNWYMNIPLSVGGPTSWSGAPTPSVNATQGSLLIDYVGVWSNFAAAATTTLDSGSYQLRYKVSSAQTWTAGPVIPYCTNGVGSFTDASNTVWDVVGGQIRTTAGGLATIDPASNSVTYLTMINGVIWQLSTNPAGPGWYSTTQPGGPYSGPFQVAPITSPGVQIASLATGTSYDVAVRVGNSFGFGPYCTPLTVSTLTPGVEAFTIATIPQEYIAFPFPISGGISNALSAPTLQFRDTINGVAGSWLSLPAPNVTVSSFSFTHPAFPSTAAATTVGIRDANATNIVATSNTFAVTTGTPPNGPFTISNGLVHDPSGNIFYSKGVASLDAMMSSVPASEVLRLFPRCNTLNLSVGADNGGYNTAQSDASIFAYVDDALAKGLVVILSDYQPGQPTVRTGQDLTNAMAWYTRMATKYKDNPYVWFTTENEVGDNGNGGLTAYHSQCYNAIRNAGSKGLIWMESQFGNPQAPGALTASTYSNMTGVGFNIHIYPWAFDRSTGVQSNYDNQTRAYVAAWRSFATSQDGVMPVIMGEGGNSTSGNDAAIDDRVISGTIGQNATFAVVQSIFNSTGSASNNFVGWWMWQWSWFNNFFQQGDSDTLVMNGNLTDYGTQTSNAM